MRFKTFNREVLFLNEQDIALSRSELQVLKAKALRNLRRRIRLCTHENIKNKLHEMFIIHNRGAYVRPHKHINNPESLHVISGQADMIIFKEDGTISNIIKMGDYLSGKKFYYRISDTRFHTLIIKSKFFIFHETTLGPFNKECTVFAPWSPPESDNCAIRNFKKEISKAVKYFNNYKN